MGFPGGASGKGSVYKCRRCKRHRFDPWFRKITGVGNGKPFQYSSCLENPMYRGAWWSTVHGSQSQTLPRHAHTHTHTHTHTQSNDYGPELTK